MLNRRKVMVIVLIVGLFASFSVFAQDATPIEYGQTIEGSLTAEAPEQFFTFTGSAGDAIDISLSSPDFDTYLFLFDSAGTELETNDDGGEGLNSRLIGYELPADGEYTIRATSFGYRDSEADRIAIGDFTLSLNTIDLTTVELDSTTTATIDTATNSSLYFSFSATDGDVIDIIVDSGSTLDTRLFLLGPFGFQVAENDDAEGSVDPALFEQALTSTGDYLLVIESENPNAVLSGELTVIIGTAELASLETGPVVVQLDSERDTQVFTFEGVAGEVITVTMEVEFRTDFGSPNIEVTQDGETIAAARSLQGVDMVSFSFELPNTGTVNVSVNSFSDLQASLSIERMEAMEEESSEEG